MIISGMKKSLYHRIIEHPDQFSNDDLHRIVEIHLNMTLRGVNAKIIPAASLLLDQRDRAKLIMEEWRGALATPLPPA